MVPTLVLTFAFASLASAHTAAWAPGMYCRGGNTTVDDSNTNQAVNPLYKLKKSDWWFQHDRGCDLMPPKAGEFLELPAGKSVTVELAHNRGQTTLSYGGKYATDWPDGQNHTEPYVGIKGPGNEEGCVSDGSLHATGQSNAAGTAFAISYQPDLSKVTLENLVVFTVLEHTPWKRMATYQVPAGLPACPPGGCHCAWLWVPDHCGTTNMYMQGFKCKVTGATSTVPVAKAKAAVLCKDDPTKCVKGAKQMIAAFQLDGNNIVPEFSDSPGYNTGMGWKSGAQNDIFESAAVSSSTSATTKAATSKTTTKSNTTVSATPKSTTQATTTKSITTSTKSATPKPTTLSSTTKSINTTTKTATKGSSPTGGPSGTIFLTTGQNWDGYTENWTWKNGVCATFTSAFISNLGSVGPGQGTCTLFDGVSCTGNAILSLSFPGQTNLGATGKKLKSFYCK